MTPAFAPRSCRHCCWTPNPDWDRLLRTVDRDTRAVPRFRHRLVAAPLGLAPQQWMADPPDTSEVIDLMRALDTKVERCEHEPAVPLSNAVAATCNRPAAGLLTDFFEHLDCAASDVPGSPVPFYLVGGQADRIYPFGPTIGTAFDITLISHIDTCRIEINAHTAAVPDRELLTECIADGSRTVTGRGAGTQR